MIQTIPASEFRPWSYVIFHEDPRTHREVYVRGVGRRRDGTGVDVVSTIDPSQASRWDRARDAYEFAAQFKPLNWWKVGIR